MWPDVVEGDRIRITHPELDPGRTGTITRVIVAGWEPLYTVRLDRTGWPGATVSADPLQLGEHGWFVDLRANEFEEA